MIDLQGKFHSFGGSYANIATSLMGDPLVMCRSGRSAKDASFRLGACPLLLLFPVRRFPNSIAMSNPNLRTRYACSAVLLLSRDDRNSRRRKQRIGGCVAGGTRDQNVVDGSVYSSTATMPSSSLSSSSPLTSWFSRSRLSIRAWSSASSFSVTALGAILTEQVPPAAVMVLVTS